jgi:hypothetical protein
MMAGMMVMLLDILVEAMAGIARARLVGEDRRAR